MANLAIIPARGGSKRIARKNIRTFLGKPIIAYQINSAKESGLFDEVMVSTDDEEIASVSKSFGASVPFMRSSENANDFATLTDVILEVLEAYKRSGKSFENVCCLLPTALLVTKEKIALGFQKLIDNDYTSVVPIVQFAYPIQRALRIDGTHVKMREEENLNTRSQDLESCYHDSGQFYWLNTAKFLQEKRFFSANTSYIELSELEAQDVDNELDWSIMTMKYNFKHEQ